MKILCCVHLESLVCFVFLTTNFVIQHGGITLAAVGDAEESCPQKARDEISKYRSELRRKCPSENDLFRNPCHSWGDYLAKARKCVRIIRHRMSWLEGRACCRFLNMDLVKIENTDEIKEMQKKLREGHENDGIWFGLNDRVEEGRWVWNDETDPDTFGQGDRTLVADKNDCAHGFLRDPVVSYVDCEEEHMVVCEKFFNITPAEPTLKIDYHQAPDILFLNTQIWVWCSGVEGRLSWMGGNNMLVGKSHLDRTVRVSEFDCIRMAKQILLLKAKKAFTNAKVGCCIDYLYSNTKLCSKTESLRFVPKPDSSSILQPKLSLDFHKRPNILVGSRLLTANCSAYIQHRAEMEWTYHVGGEEEVFLMPDDSNVEYLNKTPDGRWLRFSGNDPDKGWQGGLKMIVTADLQGAVLRCCGTENFLGGQRSCAESKQILVRFFAKKPDLQVDFSLPPSMVYGGHSVEARCTAFVGSGGRLMWALTTASAEQLSWTNDLSGSVTGDSPNDVDTAIVDVTMHHIFGPMITSILNISVSLSLDNALLSCLSVNSFAEEPTDDINGTLAVRSESLSFMVYFLSQPPLLVYQYVKTEVYVLTKGVVYAKCSAFVGSEGILTWVLLTRWGVNVWTVDVTGHEELSVWTGHVNMTISMESDIVDEKYGPYVVSAATVDLEYLSGTLTLACYSYNASGQESFYDSENLLRSAYIIQIDDTGYSPGGLYLQEITMAIAAIWLVFAILLVCLYPHDEIDEYYEGFECDGVTTSGYKSATSSFSASIRRVFRHRNTSLCVAVGGSPTDDISYLRKVRFNRQ